MKIDSNKPASTPSAPTGQARARAGQGAASVAAPNTAAKSTEANLSSSQNVESVLASTPVVDVERVAEIKRAIAEGRFQVNADRIADGLLQSVRDMLGSER